VLAKEGVPVPTTDLSGTGGQDLLDTTKLVRSYGTRFSLLRELIMAYSPGIEMLDGEIADFLSRDNGHLAIQAIPGVGPVLGAVVVAEIGDVSRFSSPEKLCCSTGLTPRHREFDREVSRDRITKQGSRILASAAIEAARRHHGPEAKRFGQIASGATRERSPGWLSPGTSSPSPTAACETERSVASPRSQGKG